jgi:hypothetical protein
MGSTLLKIENSLKLGMIFKAADTYNAKINCQKLVQLILKYFSTNRHCLCHMCGQHCCL